MVIFEQMLLYSCKVVVIGQNCCIREKVIVFLQSGYVQAKVVVFGQKMLYSCKSGFFLAK